MVDQSVWMVFKHNEGARSDGLVKIDCHLCHYALSKDELRRQQRLLVIWGLGRGWSGGPQECSLAWAEVCFSEGKQYPCWKAISSSAINQALKQDTSSYHHITPCSQKRPGLFLRPEAPHTSSENTSPSKLHRPSPLSRFSKAWFIVLLRPPNEPKQP